MKKLILAIFLFCLVFIVPVSQADVVLSAWGFNFNGTIQQGYSPDLPGAPPAGWHANYAGFDFANAGMGQITFTLTGAPGSYFFVSFLDHDIGPFPFDSNTGFSFGTPGAGQTWQLGPPGYPGDGGDTYQMFVGNTLKNLNEISPGEYGDISAALGWAFVLNANEMATITLTVGDVAPNSPFYLSEFDAATGQIIYLSQDLVIEQAGIPEPGTLGLFVTGLAGAAAWARRRLLI